MSNFNSFNTPKKNLICTHPTSHGEALTVRPPVGSCTNEGSDGSAIPQPEHKVDEYPQHFFIF